MRFGVVAGGRHARKIAQTLSDEKTLFKRGFPVRPEVVLVCAEDPRTEEGCAYWNAHQRFYWSCAEKRSKDRSVCALSGEWIDRYVTSAERWVRTHRPKLTFAYGDPCDAQFQKSSGIFDQVRTQQKLASDEAPIHALVGLPWGRWINAPIRELCGELVRREKNGTPLLNEQGKRQLIQVGDAQWSYGFVFGLHPVYACGGSVAAEALQGADVVNQILDAHLGLHNENYPVDKIEGRIELIGISGEKMDDGRLRCHEGPVGKLADWPFSDRSKKIHRRRLSQRQYRAICQEMVEGLKELVPRTLLGRQRKDVFGLGDAIADRIYVLHKAANS